jgi:hypothetical protein
MLNCEVCDQELVEGGFEEKIGICVNCAMIESRKKSSKSLIIIFMIFFGGFMFISSLLSIAINIITSYVDFEQRLVFLIPSLIWCVISGSGVIYFSVVFKNR